MKKLLSMIAAVMLALTLTACGGAKMDAGAALKAIKNYDVEKMQQYFGDSITDQLFAGAEIDGDSEKIDKKDPMAKILTGKMSYKITSQVENEDGTSAEVTAEITNYPAAKLYAKFAVEYGKLLLQNLNASDEVKADLYNQAYDKAIEGAETNTDTITFTMTSNGDNFRVDTAGTANIVQALLF